MSFLKFISYIGLALGAYYFLIISYDLLKAGATKRNKPDEDTHKILFEEPASTQMVTTEKNTAIHIDGNDNKNSTTEEIAENEIREQKKKGNALLVDLGLEIVSGDAQYVSAENIALAIV